MASNGAGAGGRKSTRFPCLATVRYMVAAVVAVLTIVVAVKMIIVDLRPEDIQLSILQGHIEASALWSRNETDEIDVNYGNEEVVVGSRRRTSPTCESNVIGVNVGLGIGQQQLSTRSGTVIVGEGEDEGEDEPRCAAPIVTYSASSSVKLRVTLSAYNPSGRVDVNCTNTTLRVLDMPSESDNITGMMEIAKLALPQKGFLVRRKSSHTVMKRILVHNHNVLSYIATMYAGKTSFKAMVQVNTMVTTVNWKNTQKNVSNTCWPVTVGLDEPSMAADAVDCSSRSSDVFGSVSSWKLAPAPAPAVPATLN